MLAPIRSVRPPFYPVACLEVEVAIATVGALSYRNDGGGLRGCSRIYYPPTIQRRLEHPEAPRFEPVAPSLLLHEVGHHVFYNMTGANEERFAEIEEGVADALAGMARGTCEIGFLEDGTPTSHAFCLDSQGQPDLVRGRTRRGVGDGFWRLHTTLRLRDGRMDPGEETIGAALLFQWLGLHRASEGDDRLFGHENDLLEQLLVADDLLTDADGIANGTDHGVNIIAAFRGVRFFETDFRRGDTDLDGGHDITDPIEILNFLFIRDEPANDCLNAFDADNEHGINVTDATYLLNFLFLGGPRPPPPFPACGFDPELPWEPGNLGCHDFACRM
jgi:hypothetical protein